MFNIIKQQSIYIDSLSTSMNYETHHIGGYKIYENEILWYKALFNRKDKILIYYAMQKRT